MLIQFHSKSSQPPVTVVYTGKCPVGDNPLLFGTPIRLALEASTGNNESRKLLIKIMGPGAANHLMDIISQLGAVSVEDVDSVQSCRDDTYDESHMTNTACTAAVFIADTLHAICNKHSPPSILLIMANDNQHCNRQLSVWKEDHAPEICQCVDVEKSVRAMKKIVSQSHSKCPKPKTIRSPTKVVQFCFN